VDGKPTDGRTDTTDFITFVANAVGNDYRYAQVCGTALLLLFVMALTDRHNSAAPPRNFIPLCVGVVVMIVGMTFGMNCGYPINPARDLSPRIFTAVAGWGIDVFTYVQPLWMFTIALLHAAIAMRHMTRPCLFPSILAKFHNHS